MLGMRADDRVLVERVVVVVAGPGVDHLDALERRHARGQPRPHLLLEEGVIDGVEVAAGGSWSSSGDLPHRKSLPSGRNHTPDGSTVSGASCSASGRLAAVDDVDVALARLDRQRDAGQRRQLAGPGSRRVDECAAGDPRAACQRDTASTRPPRVSIADHLVVNDGRRRCACAALRNRAARLGGSNQPSPERPKRASRDALRRKPGEPLRQLRGASSSAMSASMRLLQRDVLGEHRLACCAAP